MCGCEGLQVGGVIVSALGSSYFRSSQTWRQLWRVLERSTVICIVADVRFAVSPASIPCNPPFGPPTWGIKCLYSLIMFGCLVLLTYHYIVFSHVQVWMVLNVDLSPSLPLLSNLLAPPLPFYLVQLHNKRAKQRSRTGSQQGEYVPGSRPHLITWGPHHRLLYAITAIEQKTVNYRRPVY